tara:strand:+ start:137 stop:550 length:414 start_codon:yes stop_codon:yes gene_type:complete
MTKQSIWDHSLVKKYSSSNHFKLLNQLKNEIKKYPLNKKKNITSNEKNDTKYDSKDNLIKSSHKEFSYSKNLESNTEINSFQSTVSFNNSKNFSIYNSNNKDSKKEQINSKSLEINDSNEDLHSLSFKDRLNQIDMK